MSATPDLQVIDHGEKRLNELGYKQELRRGMGGFSNFAVSFTIISIITGVLQTFWLGLIAGGPRFGGSGLWIPLVGLGLCAYTITGFDASAHLSEEARDADTAGPRGIVSSIAVSAVVGLILLIALCYALPGGVTSDAYGTLSATGASASANLFLDVLGRHLAEFLIVIGIVAQFFCGLGSVTANSRMIYAFSRDGAVPGHALWHRINPRTKTPTNSIWFAVVFSFLLGVPSLKTNASGVPVAFNAVVSVAVVSFTISFALPTLLRLMRGSDFVLGRWNLGRLSKLVNVLALVWTVIICAAFLLPHGTLHVGGTFQWSLFHYAPIAVGVVVGYATITWVLSARHWFTGPKWNDDGSVLDIETVVPSLTRTTDPAVGVEA